MRHSPYYDYESFYLCDNCFEELDKLLINFLEPEHKQDNLVFKQEEKQADKNITNITKNYVSDKDLNQLTKEGIF